jgi:hypothetical protein
LCVVVGFFFFFLFDCELDSEYFFPEVGCLLSSELVLTLVEGVLDNADAALYACEMEEDVELNLAFVDRPADRLSV